MDRTEFGEWYRKIFAANHLDQFCTGDYADSFYQFTQILIEANRHMNLTAIREIPDMIAKHFADCLLAEAYFPKNATVLDVGCGGGFPTVPLAIVRNDLKIIALDSTQKKADFVRKVSDALKLENITTICARAEDKSMKGYREGFSIVTSRATANLQVLSEIAFPYVRIGGQMIALKGLRGSEELQAAKGAIRLLGGEVGDDIQCSLHNSNGDTEIRHILLINKKAATPAQYPRQYSAIIKKPL